MSGKQRKQVKPREKAGGAGDSRLATVRGKAKPEGRKERAGRQQADDFSPGSKESPALNSVVAKYFTRSTTRAVKGSGSAQRKRQVECRATGGAAAVLPAGSSLNAWYWAALAGVSILVFYPPYFRGLFFQQEQLWTLLLAAGVFALVWGWKISIRDLRWLTHPFDFLALALLLAYVAATLVAASQRLAVAEVVKVTLYFLVFWMVARLSSARGQRDILLAVLYVSAVGVAMAGLLTATGLIEIKDGFVGGRIFSTLQYPNALASFLVATGFFGFYLWGRCGTWPQFLLVAGNYVVFLVFLATGSRGGYLIYPISLILFFPLLPAGVRGRTLAHAVIIFAGGILANNFVIPAVLAGNVSGAWGWFIAGLAVVIGAHAAWYVLARLTARIPCRTRILFGACAVVAVLAIIIIAAAVRFQAVPATTGQEGILARVLPPTMLQRLQDINLETLGSAERLYWTREAMKIVAAHPVLGAGGGAWEATYRSFQAYDYSSTQVHNHFAQIWSEIGTSGMAIWVGLWVIFLVVAWRAYRRSQGAARALPATLGVAGISLGMHAFIDFDLSLGAVSMLLWSIWGLTRGLIAEKPQQMAGGKRLRQERNWLVVAPFLAAAVIAFFAASLLLGNYYARQAVAAVHGGRADRAVEYFRLASTFDPFTASYLVDRAGLLVGKDPAQAVRLARAAAEKEPFNQQVLTRLGEIEWAAGNWPEAVAAMEKARDAAIWSVQGYENFSRIAAIAAINFLSRGERQRAREYAEEAAGVPAEMGERVAKVEPEARELWQRSGRPFLAPSPGIKLNAGIAYYLLGEWDRARESLEAAAADQSVRPEAGLWLAALREKTGDAAGAQKLLKEIVTENQALQQTYTFIMGLPVPLQGEGGKR